MARLISMSEFRQRMVPIGATLYEEHKSGGNVLPLKVMDITDKEFSFKYIGDPIIRKQGFERRNYRYWNGAPSFAKRQAAQWDD